MKQAVLLVPRPQPYLDALEPGFPEVRFSAGTAPAEVEDALADAEVLVTLGHATAGMSRMYEVVRRMPRLAWVQTISAGYEDILEPLETRPDVLLTTAAGIYAPQMSEMVVLYMIALTRDVKGIVRNQDTRTWHMGPVRTLDGLTVGIVGLGGSGARIARVCKAFGMTTYGLARTRRREHDVDRLYDPSRLHELAAEVDFLVLTVPLSAETERLADASVFAAMKPTAFLLNVARGGVVDEPALIDALRRGTIAGAGLDVFEQEPLPPESPLWEMDNVFLTPHLAGFNTRYVEQLLAVLKPNLRHYLDGRRDLMVNVVARDGAQA